MIIHIIGFGRLGRLLTRYLAPDFELYVSDLPEMIKIHEKEIVHLKAIPSKNIHEDLNKADIIIPCVPISSLDEILKEIAPYLKSGALVADVCSVKEHPSKSMMALLPSHVDILGTHPMFGPDSAGHTLWGSKLVLCPIRIQDKKLSGITAYLQGHGLKIITCTPEEHDQQIAKTLILTHLIGRTLIQMKAGPMGIDTKGYRRLMRILETVENDSWELFRDMNQFNKYSKKLRDDFLKALTEVTSKL